MLRSTAAAILIFWSLAGCGLKLPHISISAPSSDPQTLDAATAAGQEVADRRTSGDFAGVWLMMSKQVRDGISQADYTKLGQTCDPTGLSAKVIGVRMEGDSRAIVRWEAASPELRAFGQITKTMLYEQGKWTLAPTPEFVTELGQPVAQIIAAEKASGRCDKDASSSSGSTATTTDPCAETGYCHSPNASTPAPARGGPGEGPCAEHNTACDGTRYALPAEYSTYQPAQEQPTEIGFDHRFHSFLNLTWVSWGPEGADGSGDESVQTDCDPNCAAGSKFVNPVQIHASNPRHPPPDSQCPTDVLFYTDIIIAYPGTVPPTKTPSLWLDNDSDLQWTSYYGMTAAHYSARKPTCI